MMPIIARHQQLAIMGAQRDAHCGRDDGDIFNPRPDGEIAFTVQDCSFGVLGNYMFLHADLLVDFMCTFILVW